MNMFRNCNGFDFIGEPLIELYPSDNNNNIIGKKIVNKIILVTYVVLIK